MLFLFYVYISGVKLFSKQRKQLIPGSNFSKYVAYAIGEIILVVIGILIAVSINNANERNKEKESFRATLQILKNDLVSDTTKVAGLMEYYKSRDSLYRVFLTPGVTEEDYRRSPMGFNLALTYNPISLNRKAYGLLENYAAQSDVLNDSIVSESIELYLSSYQQLEDNQGRIARDIDQHMADLSNNETWVIDMMRGKLTDPMMDYFTGKKYQGKLFLHVQYVKGNLLRQLFLFKLKASDLLTRIDERLNTEE